MTQIPISLNCERGSNDQTGGEYDAFLSHSAADKAWAAQLAASLLRQGVSVWHYVEQIRPGDDLLKALNEGLAQSKVVVAVIDPRTPRTPAFEAGMALGLGKELVFVVPKEIVESDELSLTFQRVMFFSKARRRRGN
jgi:TIR domain